MLDKLAEDPAGSVTVAIISQIITAPLYAWIMLRREKRTDSQAAFDRAIEFMDRQEEENRKYRERAEACERAHEKTKRIYAKERTMLQDQLTEMGDFIFERHGHRFKSLRLPEEPEEPTPKPPSRDRKPPKDKGTDDAIPELPRDGDDE